MRVEVVAVGTELLLGQIEDTNSTFIGERLAAAGIDCLYQTRVGDNIGRITEVIGTALSRNDAVICCGGLGPTQDDVTREAIAAVMSAPLVRDESVLEQIRALFESRGRVMSPSNAKQADVPAGASLIRQTRGTAPGLICPVGEKVVYAVPGVPHEMREMLERAVVPDLQARGGDASVIVSRTLRTWGLTESGLGELVAGRVAALDEMGPGAPTIAFLASGIEGIKLRLTVKAPSREDADELLSKEEAEIRALLGDVVFGVDDETMEVAVSRLLVAGGLSLAVAESLTGGIVASRFVSVPGASAWFRGGIVAYDNAVKQRLLGVPAGVPAVSAECAAAMAAGVRESLSADVGLSTTGVAGPTTEDGRDVGTVFVGVALAGAKGVETAELHLPGDRKRVRQYSAISAADLLRRRLEPRAQLASKDS